ncbi:MAG: polysaccharide biosynthesis tyrosine autokinase [Pseudomonadota bacterium]|nr:polysaccharide biosynthesis tyrosine autokinase [Pseudomonadota bacterium]
MKSLPDPTRPRTPRRRAGGQRQIAVPPPARDEGAAPLAANLQVLRDQWRLCAGVAAAVLLLVIAYVLLAPPVYEASMLIHVEETNPAAPGNPLNDVAAMFDTKKAATAEMELLHSRTVVAPAVERLKLYIDARPDYFPLLGRLAGTLRPGRLSAPGLFGVGGQVWGAERIVVPRLDVPPAMLRRTLVLTALGDQRFSLSDPASDFVLVGRVGPLLRADTPAGPLALQVTQLAGRPGARFLLTRNPAMASILQLQRALIVAEQGRLSGVIAVRLEGGDATLVTAVLQEIGRQYVAQNLARRSEEAEKSLAFLDLQLPALKARLEAAEAEYNAFRNANGTIDFAEEAKLSLQQEAAAKARRSELLQKRTELLARFTLAHPTVAAVSGQLRQVDGEIGAAARHIRALPLLEQQSLRLLREIKLDTDLYTALANTAQQLRVVSIGKVSNVRLVDAPMLADEPVRPRRVLLLAVGALGAVMLGLAAGFARSKLAGGVDDPLEIERLLGARVVFANIPHSAAQARLDRRRGAPPGQRQALLALAWPVDGAIEALRAFRASLQFSMPRGGNNVVMLAGPTSHLGKSFVTANFAAVVAAGGQRVLLVDADLRNGSLHRLFGASHQHGLCEALTGAAPLGQVIRRGVLDNLDFIPTGSLPPERPDLFMHSDVGALLASVRGHYDLVLLDSPPILALADALVLGRHAGAVFLVARAGVSTEREITESLKRLEQAGVAPCGILFNDVKPRLSGYGYKYGDGGRRLVLAGAERAI